MDAVYQYISWMGPEPALFFISMIPLLELRAGILLGTALGLDWLTVYLLSVAGNILPIPFIVLFGKRIFSWLRRTKWMRPHFKRYEAHLIKKSDKIIKYSFWGLLLFVGIPLPGTGAWSGAAIAVLLNMRLKHAVPAIFCGILLAGVIMTLGSHGLFNFLKLF